MSVIHYSVGTNQYDNTPQQKSAENFDAFVDDLLSYKSPRKGLIYICSALASGSHYERPTIYPGIAHWRLKNYGMARRFLALDLDGFASPDVFDLLRDYLQRWNCLVYTTASHTADSPRARVIVELDREVDYEEGERLGDSVQNALENEFGFGAIKFDTSVYRGTQPVYAPVLGSSTTRHHGEVMCVDTMLAQSKAAAMDAASATSEWMHSLFGSGYLVPQGVIHEGGRNEAILRYSGHLRGRGFREQEILTLAQAMNQEQCSPPLDVDEVVDICSRYGHQNIHALHGHASTAAGGAFNEARGSIKIPVTPPPKRRYVFAGQMTAGTLNVLGGQGGASKTILVMQTSVAAAVGCSIGNLAVAPGASMLFLGEEDEAERDRRLGAICAHMKADIDLVAQRVCCYGAAGIDIRLTKKVDSNAHETEFGAKVIELAKAHQEKAGVPLQMIVFDHARLVLGGDPNNAEDVTQLTRVLTHIARETGAAVILLAHSPKSVMAKAGDEINAADIAGSSAFVDNARSAFMMWTMREDEAKSHHVPASERQLYVRLGNVKANYAPTGGGYWFKRHYLPDWDVAVLEQVSLHSAEIFESRATSALRDRILSLVRKQPGGLSERKLRDYAGKDGQLKASDAKVRAEVERMLEDGLLDKRAPTADERRKHKLSGAVREVLVALS